MEFKELWQSLRDFKETSSVERKKLTPDYNLLTLISPKELQISKIIAEFLNPNGKHEQGDIFLREFINKFLPQFRKITKNKNAKIILEQDINHNGRIDILIDFDNKFAIAIENKPFADDQDKQISRYVEYLKNKYGNENFAMLYLSELGKNPTEKSISINEIKELGEKYKNISFADIGDWLEISANKVKSDPSKRLDILLAEIIEYINLVFLKTNKIKNQMLNKALEKNILEAYEIHNLWNKNKKEFDKIWEEKINYLFNNELPKLLFKELQNRKIIDENWEYENGDFDISKKTAKGISFKKKKWKNFKYAILKNKNSLNSKGKIAIFPAITTKIKPEKIKYPNEKYYQEYTKATNTVEPKEKDKLWSIPPIIWWTDFPDIEYRFWDYEQWSEIKENGKTITYLADFFEKLIQASEKDIDTAENGKM